MLSDVIVVQHVGSVVEDVPTCESAPEYMVPPVYMKQNVMPLTLASYVSDETDKNQAVRDRDSVQSMAEGRNRLKEMLRRRQQESPTDEG